MTDDAILRRPAIRVQQRIGTFWAVSIPADVLLDCTVPDPLRIVIDPAFEGTDEWRRDVRLLGNQRQLRLERLRSIAEYVDGVDSTFPNSIILAAPSEVGDDLRVHPWRLERHQNGCDHLVIPRGAGKASIVDGQHRLYSFLHSQIEDRQKFELLCAVFFDIPSSVQAYIFATINTNQKAVRRGMALNLHGYNIEDEPRETWSPEKLAVFLVRRLNYDSDSALHARIKIDAEGAPIPILLPGATRALTLAAVVDGALKQISQSPKTDRDALRSERLWSRMKRGDLKPDAAPLRSWYLASRDADIYELLRSYVAVVDDLFWKDGQERSMLTRAVGVRALFDFLAEALKRMPDLIEQWESRNQDPLAAIKQSLTPSTNIDFTQAYFEATGRGQKRILHALMLAAGWMDLDQLADSDRLELAALVPSPKSGGPP